MTKMPAGKDQSAAAATKVEVGPRREEEGGGSNGDDGNNDR